MSSGGGVLRAILDALIEALRRGLQSRSNPPGQRGATVDRSTTVDRSSGSPRPHADASPGQSGADATRDLSDAEIRRLRPSYAPAVDGTPDPGEVIWTWVPYAEHDGRGKDRPVLIIARIDATTVAGCYLSTKQHRGFISVGTGGWDGQGRESFLSPERVLGISDSGMRREGHVLDRARFERVIAELSPELGIGR